MEIATIPDHCKKKKGKRLFVTHSFFFSFAGTRKPLSFLQYHQKWMVAEVEEYAGYTNMRFFYFLSGPEKERLLMVAEGIGKKRPFKITRVFFLRVGVILNHRLVCLFVCFFL